MLHAAKRRAAEDGDTLTRVIETALRLYLRRPRRTTTPFKLELLTRTGRLLPGVTLDDRDSLYERMEGRT